MVCLGLKPGVARWKAQMNPLNYDGTLSALILFNLNHKLYLDVVVHLSV